MHKMTISDPLIGIRLIYTQFSVKKATVILTEYGFGFSVRDSVIAENQWPYPGHWLLIFAMTLTFALKVKP